MKSVLVIESLSENGMELTGSRFPQAFLKPDRDAARAAKLPADRIIILDIPAAPALQLHVNVEGLVQEGLAEPPHFVERRLNPGEAKTKLALLSFSSGTTGRPKAVAIPHYALIANVIQMSTHGRVNEEYAPWEDRRYRPGDAIYAGACDQPTAP